MQQSGRTYIAIDLKSFYASVECMERGLDPLTTNLVVADAGRTEKTICLAVSPSLKAHGISGRARLFEVVERVSADKLLELLPEALRPSYAPLVRESDPTVHDIVKAADKLSAHIKCIEELRAGNQEFASAAEQTRQALTDMHLPELDWFLEHCLDSFGKNLDQLE